MVGRVCSKDELFLRIACGTAKDVSGNGGPYELSVTYGCDWPHITSRKTGKQWVITWHQLIELAVEAGIDEEGLSLVGALGTAPSETGIDEENR